MNNCLIPIGFCLSQKAGTDNKMTSSAISVCLYFRFGNFSSRPKLFGNRYLFIYLFTISYTKREQRKRYNSTSKQSDIFSRRFVCLLRHPLPGRGGGGVDGDGGVVFVEDDICVLLQSDAVLVQVDSHSHANRHIR